MSVGGNKISNTDDHIAVAEAIMDLDPKKFIFTAFRSEVAKFISGIVGYIAKRLRLSSSLAAEDTSVASLPTGSAPAAAIPPAVVAAAAEAANPNISPATSLPSGTNPPATHQNLSTTAARFWSNSK